MTMAARYCNRVISIAITLTTGLLFASCGVTRSAILPPLPQQNSIYRNYPELTASQIDSLRSEYGTNKLFVDDFLEPTLIALSHYPELKETPIEFKYSKEATTMAARPKPMSMLYKRGYIVVINNDDSFDGIKLDAIPRNAQIGIIGHELAHIADYQNRNLWGVTGILLRYASKHRKPLFEKEIDRATIERGLGWQLHDWAAFSLDPANGSTDEYIEFKREHYLTPGEIMQHINFFGGYHLDH